MFLALILAVASLLPVVAAIAGDFAGRLAYLHRRGRRHHRAFKVRAAEIGLPQIRPAKIRLLRLGTLHPGAVEARILEARSLQLGRCANRRSEGCCR